MAETQVKISFQDEEHDGVLVDVVDAPDQSHELRLSDGSVLRIKLVVANIVRLDDLKDGLGFPTYVLQSANVMSVVKGPRPPMNKVH